MRVSKLVPGDITAEELTAVHMAGHWLSTIATLKRLGFQNLRDHRSMVKDPRKLKLLEDFELRLAGPPAGTAKLALPVVVFESMALSPVMTTCPNLAEVVAAIKIWRDIHEDDYSSLHVGAYYLTGEERVSIYVKSPEILGRAWCLVRNLMKNSTMAASPLFATGGAYAAARDFSTDFESACSKFGLAMLSSDDAQINLLSDLVANKQATTQSYFNLMSVTSNSLTLPEMNERAEALSVPVMDQVESVRVV
ncbi:Hypothetical protein FKW44_021461 [Caligus rogercresseyi]|uniref:Uncharacterized protein n=1 Tax=Caligus rogercresseyi TaxID=217165 RepID=A0A7T8GRW1_CALRO|nr:Hypothetical protein FKW44_021461 [Caligus rogercresseyi]